LLDKKNAGCDKLILCIRMALFIPYFIIVPSCEQQHTLCHLKEQGFLYQDFYEMLAHR